MTENTRMVLLFLFLIVHFLVAVVSVSLGPVVFIIVFALDAFVLHAITIRWYIFGD